MSLLRDLGRTRLLTRRQRARRAAALALGLLGLAVSVWIGAGAAALLAGHGWQLPHLTLRSPITSGGGGLLGLPRADHPAAPSRTQSPLVVAWPAPAWATVLIALPPAAVWLHVAVRPLVAGGGEPRHDHLARPAALRRALSERATRRTGHITRPEMAWWQRIWLHTSELGMSLGHPIRPRLPGLALWADWEQRIRIVARTGWGKTSRLLVPIIRALPGPALISSTEPAIFEQTVRARQTRRVRLRWRVLDLLARAWLPIREHPVAALDLSDPDARYAAGWPALVWNLLDGCADFAVAARRARALLTGTSDPTSSSGNEMLFRDSATDVLAAWLHAADLGRYEVSDLHTWMQEPHDPRPRRVLEDDPRADPSAVDALVRHLDTQAGKTTSGVLRYLVLALRSVVGDEGRALAGRRYDRHGQRIDTATDLADFVLRGGTLYVLASPNRIDRVRPLLSLVANDMFHAAETAALRRRGHRLSLPFVAVLDELRYGVPVSDLPYVANGQRKYNISFVYSVQSSDQEDEVYGPAEAQALRGSAGISIGGGIDLSSARETAERAGQAPVVAATRGQGPASEYQTDQPALSVADQQQLGDGQSVVLARGLAPFVASTPSIYQQRRTWRRISSEVESVVRELDAARAVAHTGRQITGSTPEEEDEL